MSLYISPHFFLPSWIQDLSQFELQFDGQITLSRIICATLTRCLARMQLREDVVWSVWSYSCFYCRDWGSRGVKGSSSCKRLAKRIGIRRSACRTYLHKRQQSPWLKKRNECQCQLLPSMLWHAGSVKAERIWTFQTIQQYSTARAGSSCSICVSLARCDAPKFLHDRARFLTMLHIVHLFQHFTFIQISNLSTECLNRFEHP